MGSENTSRKPHAVCVPYPAPGHINPFMQLAKLLHSRGFHITFVNTEFNHRRLAQAKGSDFLKGLPGFQFESIPDGLPPPSDCHVNQDTPSLCGSVRKNCLAPFIDLVEELNSSSEVPPVTCIISDGVMSFCIKAAEQLSIPQVQFWTASACSFMGYLHFSELIKRGYTPFRNKNLLSDGTGDVPIDWIPGLSNIRLKDLPTFIRTSNDELMFDFMGSEAENCLKSSAIVFNTFNEFEQQVLKAIVATKSSCIYTVGPLVLHERRLPESDCKSLRSTLLKEDTECLEWLDKREPNSVVYVNYGSVSNMTSKHLTELAWGLANSRHPFVWIIRPDVVKGDSVVLPEDFLEEIKDRALLTCWCEQVKVLAHPSVGVFLTHCGWNSIVEAVSCGVPMICWPFFADQHTNCRYACTTWGIGMDLSPDVKRQELEDVVKEMMEGERGKEMRQKALEWKRKAEEAAEFGGSSFDDFNRLVEEALCFDEKLIE